MSNESQLTYDRDIVRLMMMMRRFIREEFKIYIQLSSEDSIDRLLQHSKDSRNHVLIEMRKELLEIITPQQNSKATQVKKVRYYRGAAIEVEDGMGSKERPQENTISNANQRIYRGQVYSV